MDISSWAELSIHGDCDVDVDPSPVAVQPVDQVSSQTQIEAAVDATASNSDDGTKHWCERCHLLKQVSSSTRVPVGIRGTGTFIAIAIGINYQWLVQW